MLEFKPFLNSFRSLSFFVYSRSLRLAVSYVGLVITLLFSFFEY